MKIEDDEYFIGYFVSKCKILTVFDTVFEFSTINDFNEAISILTERCIPFAVVEHNDYKIVLRNEDSNEFSEIIDSY